jgi:sulfur-oxidizing protein SoxX
MKKKILIISGMALLAVIAIQGKDKDEKFQQAMDTRRDDQKACSGPNVVFNGPKKDAFVKDQTALIVNPEGNKFAGDHLKGKDLFKDGKKGNCYACHCGEPGELGCGNIGPSLKNYSKSGVAPEIIYKKIFNSWSVIPCSAMPRFGVHKQLTSEEVSNIVAYLSDVKSSLNK